MTTIHMETEKVHALAKKLDSEGERMLSSLSQTRSAASRLHFTWQGGNADNFNDDLNRLIRQIENHIISLQNLSAQVSHEADEWTSKDVFDRTGTNHSSLNSPALLSGTTLFTAAATAAIAEQNIHTPSWLEEHFIFDLGASLNKSYLSRTGKQNWHHEKFKPQAELKVGVGDTIAEGKYYSWGKWEAGAKVGVDKKGWDAGVYAEGSVFEAHKSEVVGSSLFGFTATGAVSAGSAEVFAGMKDNRVGASIGGSLVSGELGIGLNLFGYNIGLSGGAGLGLEAGFKIGAKTEAKLGPFKLGISIGKAVVEE